MKKITLISNIYEKNPNFKGKPSFEKWCNYCRRYGHSIAECQEKQQINQNNPQKYKEPIKSFYQYMKKDQNLPNKNIHKNNRSGKPLPDNYNKYKQQSTYQNNYRGRSPDRRKSQNFSQNRYIISNSQNNQYRNNYSRSKLNKKIYSNYNRIRSHSNSRIRYYSNNGSRKSSYNRNNRQYSDNSS